MEFMSAPRPTTTSSAPRGGLGKVAEPLLLRSRYRTEHGASKLDAALRDAAQ
jgi:hypothetical protein